MSVNKIRIATRKSPLAMWQAKHVMDKLCTIHTGLEVELFSMQTQGDKILDAPLSTVGGKGLFIKELEEALFAKSADIAVHSMKDVTIDLPKGLELPVILQREDPRDVFVSNQYAYFDDLPRGACVGTSALRRQCQLRAHRPDLDIRDLRGNVETRLRKLDEGIFDAIILAAAGVKRLGLEHCVKEFLEPEIVLPAIGQGAIGIEIRADDPKVFDLIKPLNDEITQQRVAAERAFSRRLFGGCQLPIAAHATIAGEQLSIQGLVGRIDGSEIIRDNIAGAAAKGEQLGLQLAEQLLAQGADIILQEVINA